MSEGLEVAACWGEYGLESLFNVLPPDELLSIPVWPGAGGYHDCVGNGG